VARKSHELPNLEMTSPLSILFIVFLFSAAMEDAHTAVLEFEEDNGASFFGVFDGHGGIAVARYAGANCHKRLASDPEFLSGNYHQALRNTFLGIDQDMLRGLFSPLSQTVSRR